MLCILSLAFPQVLLSGRKQLTGTIKHFRDDWLQQFFIYATPHRHLPKSIESALARKLDIINAARTYHDLRSPPGNRLETLKPPLQGYYAIRVNEQYRLIFRWINGEASDLYLDPHSYRHYQ